MSAYEKESYPSYTWYARWNEQELDDYTIYWYVNLQYNFSWNTPTLCYTCRLYIQNRAFSTLS